MTSVHEISNVEEQWSPARVLLRIATRSQQFGDYALDAMPLASLDNGLSQRHPIWSPLPPLPLSNTLRAFRQQAQRGIALNFDWPFPGITNDALSMSCVEQFVFANDGF